MTAGSLSKPCGRRRYHILQQILFCLGAAMFRHHLNLRKPAYARMAHVRAATEVALLVAALGFLGAMSTHPFDPRWEASDTQPCVHMGRAGAICDNRKSDVEQNCEHLGRAGRFCPPSGR